MAARKASPLLEDAVERLRDLEPVTAALSADSPAHALHELAEDHPPLALVLGSSHRGPLGRVFLGSVGQALLSGARCAIAVAPRGCAESAVAPLRKIGVGVNGSPESWSAFAAAVSLSARVEATLVAIAVVEPPRYGYSASIAILSTAEYASAEKKRATEGLAEAERRAPSSLSLIRRLRTGPVETALAQSSDELDLLIVGSRSYGPIRRVLLGGISARLIHRVKCPLLVLPRGGGADPLRFAAGDEREPQPASHDS